MTASPIPVLEVGGTHVSAALVAPAGWTVSGAVRFPLEADAPADELIERFAAAARAVAAPDAAVWGVAMPDPFDYVSGIGRFAGVAKFAALNGVDVGAALRGRLGGGVAFLNDADAFTLGEWTAGAGRGASRLAGITLGTGVGSGWVVDGQVIDPGYPPGGRIHQVEIDGRPLEDVMSRRAIRRAWVEIGRDPAEDVREICAHARGGDAQAGEVLRRAFEPLGGVVGAALVDFHADALVIGGSMAASWDVVEGFFRAGAATSAASGRSSPEIRLSADAERSGFVGAAVCASR